MTKTNLARLHATVDGRVQGVGFRYFVLEKALAADLTGWVRNTSSGMVEVMVEGPLESLQDLLEALHAGPRSSRIDKVDYDWGKATGEFPHFEVRRTAYSE